MNQNDLKIVYNLSFIQLFVIRNSEISKKVFVGLFVVKMNENDLCILNPSQRYNTEMILRNHANIKYKKIVKNKSIMAFILVNVLT
ncbi:unnamed protein product [Paramecium pentaurelia]|uniref:Uncharacterized protein n=1 Tax=Paramecium pentaurelia TaxID=43138 RepID=A0A8S1TI60_9CILI|nr:unnamed protein product [Paramecium pentaurelia]